MKTQSLEIFFTLLALFCCVAQAAAEPAASPEPGSGLEGSILLHTVTGGPVIQGVPDSKPLDHTTFEVKKADQTVASFTTDEQGRFRISLPPGHYRISKKDYRSRVGFYGPFDVDIAAGQIKKVQWNCETGMQ